MFRLDKPMCANPQTYAFQNCIFCVQTKIEDASISQSTCHTQNGKAYRENLCLLAKREIITMAHGIRKTIS